MGGQTNIDLLQGKKTQMNLFFRSSFCSMYLPQCSKCQTIISANELVMRADDKYIYHIDCFTCCLCNVVLKPGDDYGLHGSLLFCRLHLEQTTNTTFSLCSPIKNSSTNNLNMKKSRQNGTTTQRKQRTKLNNLENNTNNLEITSKKKTISILLFIGFVFFFVTKRFFKWK
jgi:hypothetical protein